MNGVDPAYREQMTRFGAGRPRELTRFEQSHEHAIRYHAVLTGRDVIAELRRAMAAATSDSSRLVYGAMLLGLGELVPDADSVARRLRGSDVERQLASLELNSLFGGGVALGRARPPLAPRADEATAAALLDTLLAIVITGAPAWPPLDSGAVGRRQAERVAEAGTTVFVLGDDLPAVVRERWSSRARIVTSEEWRQRRLESGGVLVTPFAVRLAGPLALVQYDRYSVQLRGDGRAPYGYASGRTFYLLRTDEGWRVVGGGMWIT